MPLTNQNATASFSGFLYQADIALLKALEKIESIGNEKELEKWTLEVEGEEDFTLIEEDGGKIRKEAYQVKETKGKEPKNYTEAVIKLFENFRESKKKEFLVTEKKINFTNEIEFFDGLYTNNGLTTNQTLLKYLFNGIGNKGTFLKEKIKKEKEKYLFKDGETKDTIQKFVNENVREFLNGNFGYIHGGNFEDIKKNILGKIKNMKNIEDNEKADNYFKFLESKIKRLIQGNKIKLLNGEEIEKITFVKIKEILDKDVLSFSKEDYQDMLVNDFIKDFNDKLNSFLLKNNIKRSFIKSIYDEINNNDEYINFIEEVYQFINDEIFLDNKKTIGFIKYTIGDKDIENIEKVDSFDGLDNFKNKIKSFKPKILQKTKMVVLFLYAKKNNN